MGGEVIKVYEGVVFRENFKISRFRKTNDKLFTLRQKDKHKDNDLMQRTL